MTLILAQGVEKYCNKNHAKIELAGFTKNTLFVIHFIQS